MSVDLYRAGIRISDVSPRWTINQIDDEAETRAVIEILRMLKLANEAHEYGCLRVAHGGVIEVDNALKLADVSESNGRQCA